MSEISCAGAIGTCTHGSGKNFGILAMSVSFSHTQHWYSPLCMLAPLLHEISLLWHDNQLYFKMWSNFFTPFWVANSFVERRTCLIKLPCSWSGFVAQLVEEVPMQLESGWHISLNPVEVKFSRLLLCNCFHCRFLRKTVSLVVYFAYDQWVRILLFYWFSFSTVN